MPWGIVAAAGIGAAGSIIGSNTQADAQKQASQTQLQMFNTINNQEQPFIQAGYGATTRLGDLLGTSNNVGAKDYGDLTRGFTPTDFLNNLDPGYQFQLQTGGQAVRNANTPGVGALSGPALKDLMSFNQGVAATGYQNAFNRFTTQQNNIFSRLSAIAGLGQNAATNTGTAGTALGTGMAQAQAAAGGSLGAGIVGASNAIGNSVSLASLLNSGSRGGNNNPSAWDTENPNNFQDFGAGLGGS